MKTFPIIVETIDSSTDIKISQFEADFNKYFEVNKNNPVSKAMPFLEIGASWEGDKFAGTFKRIYVKGL